MTYLEKILRWKNFRQKLRRQVVEAKAIQKLTLPYPCYYRYQNDSGDCWKLLKCGTVIIRVLVSLPSSWSGSFIFWLLFKNFIATWELRPVTLKNSVWVTKSWSSGNAFVSGAGGLRFKSRAGQIGHSVANGSPPLRHFVERSCVARAQWRGDWPDKLVTRFGVIQRV